MKSIEGPKWRAIRATALTGTCTATLLLMMSSGANSAQQQNSPTESPTVFITTTSSNPSTGQALLRRAMVDESTFDSVQSILGEWAKKGSSNRYIPGTDLTPGHVKRLQAELVAARSSVGKGGNPPNALPNHEIPSGEETALSEGPSKFAGAAAGSRNRSLLIDPLYAPVRGVPGTDHSWWNAKPVALSISGSACGPLGCKVTDRYDVKLTIIPTRRQTTSTTGYGSRVDFSAVYAMPDGNFTNAHLDGWGIANSGTRIMTKTTKVTYSSQIPPPNYFHLKNDSDFSGRSLKHSIKLWVKDKRSVYTEDAMSTDFCWGESGSGVRCMYP